MQLSSLVSQVTAPIVHNPKAKVVKLTDKKAPKSAKPNSPIVKVEVKEVITAPVVVKEVVVKAEKPMGIGKIIVQQLKAGQKPKEVLEMIKIGHPDCKTTMACVYWYASKINGGYM